MDEHLLDRSQYDSRFDRQSQKGERSSQTILWGTVLTASFTVMKNSCTLNTSSRGKVTYSFNQHALDLRTTGLLSAMDMGL